MVLSGSNRTTYISSISNRNSGGGSKKCGLFYQIGRSSAISVAFKQHTQDLTFLKGMKYVLERTLKMAIAFLAEKQAIKDAADAEVTSKIATANALPAVTVASSNTDGEIITMISNATVDDAAALQAILDARAAVVAATTEVSNATTSKNTAQTKYDNYTA